MKKDSTLEGNNQCSLILIGPNCPAAFDIPQNSVVQLGTDQQTPQMKRLKIQPSFSLSLQMTILDSVQIYNQRLITTKMASTNPHSIIVFD